MELKVWLFCVLSLSEHTLLQTNALALKVIRLYIRNIRINSSLGDMYGGELTMDGNKKNYESKIWRHIFAGTTRSENENKMWNEVIFYVLKN